MWIAFAFATFFARLRITPGRMPVISDARSTVYSAMRSRMISNAGRTWTVVPSRRVTCVEPLRAGA